MQIQVTASDANNIICEVTPPAAQLITIDRGVVGNGIESIVPVTISTFQYLRITYTDGTVVDVGPLTSTAYTATAPIDITGNTISLLTVPIATGGTGATTAAAAIQNLLPSYTANGNKRLGLNAGATALEWVADGGGTVTSIAVSGGTTGLTTSGGPITGSGTITLAGTLAVANGGTGVTTSTGTGSVVLSTSPTLVTPALGTPTSGNFSTGTFTWPTFNQNTTGTAAGLSATLAITSGGTGATTANDAFNALAPSQTGNSGKYLTTDGTNTSWATNPLGTVTSVQASGGTTGLSFTGGPITTSGTLTLSGTLAVANGGTGITAFGTGVATALGINVGTAGAFVVNGGALGTPASGTVTNLTGTASININGTVGATTASTGAFTTLTTSSTVTLNGGTANGVAYLNGSKVLTTGSALTFDGTKVINGDGSGSVSEFRTSTTNAAGAGGFLRGYRNAAPTYYVGDAAPITGSAGDGFVTYVYGNNPAITYINGSEQMRLTSTGLGIGTSSPLGRLHTSETNGINYFESPGISSIALQFRTNGTNRYRIGTPSASADLQFLAGGTTETMRLDSSGNLGLGVTPSAWSTGKAVEVGALGNSLFGVSLNEVYVTQNAYFNAGWKYAATATAARYGMNSGAHQWFNAPSGTAGNAISFTQAMSLDASGNLLVGVTSANAAGGATFNRALSASHISWINNATIDGATHASFRTNGTQVGFIATSGGVTIFSTTSDYRLKNVVGAVTGQGARIDALQPIEYTWKSDGSRTRGFLAHQFQEVYAGSVMGAKDAVDAEGKPVYQGMQPSTPEVMADLVAEIQSLRARVLALESN